MPLTINIRHLKRDDLTLEGSLEPAELELETPDEVIHTALPITYELVAEMMQANILVQGTIKVPLDCECVRCLRPFRFDLVLDHWACHLQLEGEDAVPINNDLVDLTPYIREDIFLALPQHPVCNPECDDVPNLPASVAEDAGRKEDSAEGSSAWSELNKLKLD